MNKILSALIGVCLLVSSVAAADLSVVNSNSGTNTIVVDVKAPAGLFLKAVVYKPNLSLVDAGVVLGMDVAPGLVGQKLYYGDLTKAETNTVALSTSPQVVIFGLNTNTTFYFYVTGLTGPTTETLPSNAVIYRPER